MEIKWISALLLHGLESHAILYTFVSESIKKGMLCLKLTDLSWTANESILAKSQKDFQQSLIPAK